MNKVRIEPLDWGGGPEDYEAEYGSVDWRGKRILDIGADVGSTADYFLRNGALEVIAVEGSKSFYKRLEENARRVKGIKPVFLWISEPAHFTGLIKEHKPDVVQVDCEYCEKHLFNIPDEVFSMIPEYIIETHTDPIFHAMENKCRKNGYKIVNVLVRHRPDLRIVHAKAVKNAENKRKLCDSPPNLWRHDQARRHSPLRSHP